LRIIFGDI